MDKTELFTELNRNLIDAENADGFLITVTRLNDKILTHYHCDFNFRKDDLLPSLEQIKKNIVAKYDLVEHTCKIRKFEQC